MQDNPSQADGEPEDEPSRELIAFQANRGITQRARGEFDAGQMDLIRATVAKDCNPAELAMFLEVCARYELDPFSKQVWAIKIRGAVQTVVSRDGLLSIANRHTPGGVYHVAGPGEFLGCESDVVRSNDTFRKTRGKDGTYVEHSYPAKERGPILGAWAIVHRREHSPTYFFAEWDTYNTGQNVWKTHPEAMIIKSAEAMALRKAFSITGMIGEEEVPKAMLTAAPEDDAGGEIDWGEDAEVERDLRQVFAALGWRRAKIRMTLRPLDDAGRRALLVTLTEQVRKANEAAPVVDGEVVS